MTSTLAFINQKGGVGKTTLVANCGAYWARQGYRVLLIDLDPQAHLTLHLGNSGEREDVNLYRILRGDLSILEAPVNVEHPNLEIIPSHIDLSAAESEFGQEVGREMLLRDQLAKLLDHRSYDLILIDCPPSLGLLSFNALAAVEDVVIPVQAEFFALQGMAQLLKVVQLVRDRLHPILKWRAIVPTLVDIRTNLGREVISELRNHFPGLVTKHLLRKRVKVAEAPSFGQSIFAYAKDSPEAEEFAQLARELEERLAIAPPSGIADEEAGRESSVEGASRLDSEAIAVDESGTESSRGTVEPISTREVDDGVDEETADFDPESSEPVDEVSATSGPEAEPVDDSDDDDSEDTSGIPERSALRSPGARPGVNGTRGDTPSDSPRAVTRSSPE